MKKLLIYTMVVATVIAGIVSCENDLNTLGSDILGQEQLAGRIQQQDFDVISYNALLNPIQTNNFNSMLLGFYKDDVFGNTVYEFVSQVNLTTSFVNFGEQAEIDSVAIEIPYFSRVTGIDGDATTYELDSLYGDVSMHLEIFENRFFLNSFDIQDLSQNAIYYNDLKSIIESNLVGNEPLYEDPNFIPSPREVILKEGDEITERLSPRFRLSDTIPNDFWKEKLLVEQTDGTFITNPVLQSSSDFLNLFRGLYFRFRPTSLNGSTGHLSSLNINDAEITIYASGIFPELGDVNGDDLINDDDRFSNTFILGFDGIKFNFISNDFKPAIISEIQSANDNINGEENLFLKGGQGSIAILELFGQDLDLDGEADALTALKEENILINDAILNLYVDQDRISASGAVGPQEPERVTIFNLEDNTVLADYLLATDNFSPVNSLRTHLGRLVRETNGDLSTAGVNYQIGLTEHVRSVISGDQENVKLGVAVSQNVFLAQNSMIRNQSSPIQIDGIPLGSAYSHEGTILHGNLSPDPEKRLKLELYYTPIEE